MARGGTYDACMRTDLPRQSIAFASRTPCDALTLVKMAAAASKSSDSTAVSSWLPSDSSLCAPDLLAALLREGRRRLVSSEPTSARQPKTQRARGRIVALMASLHRVGCGGRDLAPRP